MPITPILGIVEGTLFVVAIVVALVLAYTGVARRRQGPKQQAPPPKPTSAPDDWQRPSTDGPAAPDAPDSGSDTTDPTGDANRG